MTEPEMHWESEVRWRQAQYREYAMTPFHEVRKWRRRFWLLAAANAAFVLLLIGCAIAIAIAH